MLQRIYAFISNRVFMLAIFGSAVMLMGQLLGRQFWQLELFSHFMPHYALLMVLVAILFPPFNNSRLNKNRRSLRAIFLLTGAGLALWCVMPVFNQTPILKTDKPIPITIHISIGYQNVNVNNHNYQAVLTSLSQHPHSRQNAQNGQSDVLILLEADADWRTQVQRLNADYQFICGNEQHSPFAIQIFSQIPIKCELQSLAGFPMAKLTLTDGRTIFAVHPPPPLGSELASVRTQYLQVLQTLVKQEKTPVMVIGDMNLSAFSPLYRDFIQGTGLYRTMANGIPTWLPLGISIDQILINHEFADTKLPYPLAWNGSDHRGFFVVW